MDDDQAEKLALQTKTVFNTDDRRKRQWFRWLVLEEDFVGLVHDEISRQFTDVEIKKRLGRLISISRNVALDVIGKVCVVYDGGVTRTITGANGDQNDAFAELVAESGIDEDAVDWHRYAYGIGPCQAIPQITEGELDFEFLVPHTYNAVPHPNPKKGVLAASWEFVSPTDHEVNTVTLDSEAWRYYDVQGGGKPTRLVQTVPHGLGVFPGSTLRFTRSYGPDWWCTSRLERVYRGTLEVALTNTLLQIVRRTQNRKLLSIIGVLEGIAPASILDVEVGISAQTDTPEELRITVDDFDVDPENFIKHITWMESGIIESFDIPAHAVTFDATSGSPGERIQFTQKGLTRIRKRQLPKIRRFERELWYRAVLLAKRQNHRLASRLPDAETVRAGFKLNVPPLAQTFTDPLIEQQWWDGQIKAGQATYQDQMMAANPGMTPSEADKRVRENLDKIGDVRKLMAERIFRVDVKASADEAAGLDGKPGEGIAEALGREGGKASGEARADDGDDAESDENDE